MNRYRLCRLHDEFLSKTTSISSVLNTMHVEKEPNHRSIKLFNDTIEAYQDYLVSFQHNVMEAVLDETSN